MNLGYLVLVIMALISLVQTQKTYYFTSVKDGRPIYGFRDHPFHLGRHLAEMIRTGWPKRSQNMPRAVLWSPSVVRKLLLMRTDARVG